MVKKTRNVKKMNTEKNKILKKITISNRPDFKYCVDDKKVENIQGCSVRKGCSVRAHAQSWCVCARTLTGRQHIKSHGCTVGSTYLPRVVPILPEYLTGPNPVHPHAPHSPKRGKLKDPKGNRSTISRFLK